MRKRGQKKNNSKLTNKLKAEDKSVSRREREVNQMLSEQKTSDSVSRE